MIAHLRVSTDVQIAWSALVAGAGTAIVMGLRDRWRLAVGSIMIIVGVAKGAQIFVVVYQGGGRV